MTHRQLITSAIVRKFKRLRQKQCFRKICKKLQRQAGFQFRFKKLLTLSQTEITEINQKY